MGNPTKDPSKKAPGSNQEEPQRDRKKKRCRSRLKSSSFPSQCWLDSKEEEEVGGGGDGARHLGAEEHPAAGCPQGHGEGGGFIQEKDPGAGFRSEKLRL